ncbi:MAG: preprotein translocase subunit SecG [Ilumatobacteraceae bacterium]
MSDAPLLEVTDLTKEFTVKSSKGLRSVVSTVQAVTKVSFSIGEGQTLGLVGESGSGKTTTGRCLLRLIEPTSGSVRFRGEELVGMPREDLRKLRRRMQIVFQDPQASLDPRLTVGSAISEPLRIQRIPGNHDERVAELLNIVGLAPDHARRFPHEFSGGQRQRIGIARALALEPDFIVLDEPVSALDVSIQAGVVNLLQDLQERLGLSYLFIAHDLSVIRHMSNMVGVMYLGKLVEIATAEDIYTRPTHPYTQALLSAIPEADPEIERTRHRVVLTGDVPSPINPPSGCRFRTRCPKAQEQCAHEEPELIDRGFGHPVAPPLLSLDISELVTGSRHLRREPIGSSTVRSFLTTVTVNVVSMFAMVAGILMHSGRGGGLSDMFGGGGGVALGLTAAERNLNRITTVLAMTWGLSHRPGLFPR